MRDKLEGGILGLAVGDALGVPVEFTSRLTLQANPVTDMVGYGSHNVPEGTWSDDTSLTLAAIDSIREYGFINYDDIMKKFTEWCDSSKYTATGVFFDIGIATNNAISKYKLGVKPTSCGGTGQRDNGNGSLMRILPFVYFLKSQDLSSKIETKIINDASSLTHRHEISRLGCKIYSDYISLLLDGIDKEEALNQIKKNNYEKDYSLGAISKYSRILSDDLKNIKENDIRSSGYVVDSLEASIWCTLNSDNFEDAVIKAVNLGNDTDTVGAITGSINGIIYGKSSIPNRWASKLRNREYLEQTTDEMLDVLKFPISRTI